ncbi:MAG: pilus assembly protein PilP [Nitrospirae bacterium]|nr:pilus assembly protein PilP [Nitrospirota bacterium]
MVNKARAFGLFAAVLPSVLLILLCCCGFSGEVSGAEINGSGVAKTKEGPGAAPSAKASGAPSAEEEELAMPAPITPYVYNPTGRRDPFMSIIELNKAKKVQQSRPQRILTPLESTELGEMTLVGVVINARGKYAVVTLKDGKSYTVVKGTPIGRNGGTVLRIEPDKITIEEKFTNEYGKAVVQPVLMCLYHEEGEECK